MTDDTLRTIAALRRLAVIGLAEHGDPQVQALAARILAFTTGEGDASLDDAISLSAQRGKPTWRVAAARAERNRLLRLAALAFCPGAAPTEAARAIASEWRSYYRTDWKQDAAALACPARIRNTLREPLWRIMCVFPRVLSEKQIAEILRETDESDSIRSALNLRLLDIPERALVGDRKDYATDEQHCHNPVHQSRAVPRAD